MVFALAGDSTITNVLGIHFLLVQTCIIDLLCIILGHPCIVDCLVTAGPTRLSKGLGIMQISQRSSSDTRLAMALAAATSSLGNALARAS